MPAPTRTSRDPAAIERRTRITGQPDRSRGGGTRGRHGWARVDGEGELLVRRSRLRVGIAKRDQPHQGLTDFAARCAHRGKCGAILGFPKQNVLQEDDRCGGASRIALRRLAHALQTILRIARPGRGIFRQRIERSGQSCRVCAFRRYTGEFELCGEVPRPGRERFEQLLRLRVVCRSTSAFELLRQGVWRLEIGRVELYRPAPMAHRLLQVALSALREREQTLDGRVPRRQLGRPGQPGGGLVHLLLSQEKQPEIRPAGCLIGHELQKMIQLLARVQILARLHGGQRYVKCRDRLTVGRVVHPWLAPATHRGGDRPDEGGRDQDANRLLD